MIKYGWILIVILILLAACGTPEECRETFPPEEFPMVDCDAIVAPPAPTLVPVVPSPQLPQQPAPEPTADEGIFDFLTPSPVPTLPVFTSILATPTPTPWR